LITEIALEPRTLQGMSENGRLENNWEGRSGKSLSHLSMGGEVKAYVDRAKMSQVIHNLVSNGLKFTPPGGHVTVTVTLEEECMLSSPTPRGFSYTSTPLQGKNDGVSGGPARPPMWVKITVTDTGVGLSQVERSHCSLQIAMDFWGFESTVVRPTTAFITDSPLLSVDHRCRCSVTFLL